MATDHDRRHRATPFRRIWMLLRKWAMVLTEGATENGFYALKFFPHHFGPIAAKIDLFNDLPDHCAGPVPA